MWLSSYNQTTQNNDSNKVIKLMQFQKAASGCDSFHFTEQYHTFLKGSDIVNITINLHNVDTDTIHNNSNRNRIIWTYDI